jgi:hypothetical protein
MTFSFFKDWGDLVDLVTWFELFLFSLFVDLTTDDSTLVAFSFLF